METVDLVAYIEIVSWGPALGSPRTTSHRRRAMARLHTHPGRSPRRSVSGESACMTVTVLRGRWAGALLAAQST